MQTLFPLCIFSIRTNDSWSILYFLVCISIFSAIYLTILGSSQYIAIIAGAPESVVISGTSIMIVISVSIETIQQIVARRKALNLFKTKTIKKMKGAENLVDSEDQSSILW